MLKSISKSRPILLLDFLAPRYYWKKSLLPPLTDSSPKWTKQHRTFPVHTTDATIIDELRDRLDELQSPETQSEVDIFNTLVNHLRRDLNAQNITSAWKQWQALKENDMFRFLGPPHFVSFSTAITSHLQSVEKKEVIREEDLNILEQISLETAAAGTAEALKDLMMYYIKREDADSVLRLYMQLRKLLVEKGAWEREPCGPEEASSELASVRKGDGRRYYGEARVSILFMAVAAYAMKDSFEGALKITLDNIARLRRHTTTTELMMELAAINPKLHDKLAFYIPRLDIARLVYQSDMLAAMVAKFKRKEQMEPLILLYDQILKAMSGPNAFIAAFPEGKTPTKLVSMTDTIWTSFLSAFLNRGRHDLGRKLWDDMVQLGIAPGITMWTALIDALKGPNADNIALQTWNTMLKSGTKPDGLTYRALISVLFNGNRADEAMKFFKQFENEMLGKRPPENRPHIIILLYNTVLNGLLFRMREDDAKSLLERMHIQGPKPDIVSYNNFLGFYGKRGQFKKLAAVVSKMGEVGITADNFTFSSILSALLKAGREDAPNMVMKIMRRLNVQPNSAIFSSIIDQQLREKTEENLVAALKVLDTMEEDPDARPTEVTYTSILGAICRDNWLTPEQSEQYRQGILQRMKKQHVLFTKPAYSFLLTAYMESSFPESLYIAMGYYDEMVTRNMGLDQNHWFLLLNGLISREEWVLADKVASDMRRCGYKPGGAIQALLEKLRRRSNKGEPRRRPSYL